MIFESTDGFEIARRDLSMRGPGEYLGQRQSGQPLLRFADLERDADLVEAAQQRGRRADRCRPGRGARARRALAGLERQELELRA